ncbi:MAG: integrase [Planctomycetota bacterium]|jgi:integrase
MDASRSASKTHTPAMFERQATGQAFVKLDGRHVSLGKFGTEEAEQNYRRTVAEWKARGCWGPKQQVLVKHVIASYWKHAEVYYRKNGNPTSELSVLRLAMRYLNELYGPEAAAEFGPLKLKACREEMIDAGLRRSTINGYVSRIKQSFRWATENELIPGGVHQALQAVAGLKRGRSRAKESKPVPPVDLSDVESAVEELPRQVAAMVWLQWWTGMRPQEVVQMRMCDLDRGGRVWLYRPRTHKCEHLDVDRVIAIGPKGQEILQLCLKLDPEASLFSPKDAERDRRAEQRSCRKTKLWRSHSNKARRLRRGPKAQNIRDCYDTASYRRAVARACGKAGVARWSPNQLRHSAATRIRKEFGIESAQAVLGHRNLETTQVYAEVNQQRAVEAMERFG